MVDSSFEASLRARIEGHNSFFNELIKVIPAKYYIPAKDDGQQNNSWLKYGQNKKGKAPKQEVKEGSKKAKKARLDPSSRKSVLDIQEELASKQQEGSAEVNGESDSDGGSGEEDDEEHAYERRPNKQFGNSTPASTIDELRQRLADRIAALRGKRKLPSDDAEGTQNKRPKKDTRKKEATAPAPRQERAHLKAKDATGRAVTAGDGEIVYSKFDFSAIEKKNKKQSKDYKALLAKAESNKAKLTELKASDPEKAKEAQAKLKQRKALEMAMGIKQMDDPSLLKKTIKAKEKIKKKSKQAWKARDKAVKDDIAKRQKKRQENIQARAQGKKDKRMNKGKKPANKKGSNSKVSKGRPGFEGKKR